MRVSVNPSRVCVWMSLPYLQAHFNFRWLHPILASSAPGSDNPKTAVCDHLLTVQLDEGVLELYVSYEPSS